MTIFFPGSNITNNLVNFSDSPTKYIKSSAKMETNTLISCTSNEQDSMDFMFEWKDPIRFKVFAMNMTRITKSFGVCELTFDEDLILDIIIDTKLLQARCSECNIEEVEVQRGVLVDLLLFDNIISSTSDICSGCNMRDQFLKT